MLAAQEKIEWQESPEWAPREVEKPILRKKMNRARWKSVLTVALTVAVAATFAGVTINLTVVKGAQIRMLQKEIKELKAGNNLIQVQVDKLRSVSRIESMAIAMGMEKPSGTVYVAGTLPVAKNHVGETQNSTMPQETAEKLSLLKQFSRKFTSFFASTQR